LLWSMSINTIVLLSFIGVAYRLLLTAAEREQLWMILKS
jgi:hypothetical protein